jgi:hypothetical protein
MPIGTLTTTIRSGWWHVRQPGGAKAARQRDEDHWTGADGEEDEHGQPRRAPALQWDGHDDYSFTGGPPYGGYVVQRTELQS